MGRGGGILSGGSGSYRWKSAYIVAGPSKNGVSYPDARLAASRDAGIFRHRPVQAFETIDAQGRATVWGQAVPVEAADNADLFVRPQRMRIVPVSEPAGGDAARLTGRVLRSVFVGDHVEVLLRRRTEHLQPDRDAEACETREHESPSGGQLVRHGAKQEVGDRDEQRGVHDDPKLRSHRADERNVIFQRLGRRLVDDE